MKNGVLDSSFLPRRCDDLIRLGKDHDGGYLVSRASVESADLLLSFGIADDWSFEADFLARNPVPLHAFDGSRGLAAHRAKLLRSIFQLHRPRRFLERWARLRDFKAFFTGPRVYHQLMVAAADDRSPTLGRILETYALGKHAKIFIKADIEGCEYRFLDDLLRHADLIAGLTLEFHDVDVHFARIVDFMERFPLKLCHCHPNNSAGVAPNGVPYLLELSFARPDSLAAEPASLPHALDQANNPRQEDIRLTFA
jgi:hypothetical protein